MDSPLRFRNYFSINIRQMSLDRQTASRETTQIMSTHDKRESCSKDFNLHSSVLFVYDITVTVPNVTRIREWLPLVRRTKTEVSRGS